MGDDSANKWQRLGHNKQLDNNIELHQQQNNKTIKTTTWTETMAAAPS